VPRSHCEIAVLKLTLPDAIVDVEVVRRVRKTIGIRIVAGRVEIAAHPRVPVAQLQRLLEQKRDWITRHLQLQRHALREQQQALTQVWLAGEALTIRHQPEMPAGVRRQEELLLVGGPEEQIKVQLAEFLHNTARVQIPRRFAEMQSLAVRLPARLQLSSARTRWGSCSQQGVIRLNWRLVQAPPEVLDYVIAHELAHLRHMNHSAAFWNETARMFSNWKSARAWLKTRGESLFLFG
jgi:predicted metal-dependent hydrolase